MFVDYDKFAKQYGSFRIPDKRIAGKIFKHLEGAKRIIKINTLKVKIFLLIIIYPIFIR